MVAQGPVLEGDYGLMAQGGAEVLRFPLEWAQVERRPGVYDWAAVDAVVGGAAAQGIEPLPFVWATPDWLSPNKAIPPLESVDQRRAWQRFLAAAAARYGSLVDKWQLWNEPNFKVYWKPKPEPREYAQLVRLGARTIRDADPDAEILLGGVAPVKRGMLPWEFLEELYGVRGIERSFDTVTVHPYFPEIDGVEFQVRQALDEIDAAGDRRARIRVTELGWASDGPAADPMTKGLGGQAQMLRRSFRLLTKKRRDWGITGVDWHSFQDVAADQGEPVCSFCPGSGLVTASREPKPAFDAFADFAR
jgi:polysaccharide biosynthesis protein PslG